MKELTVYLETVMPLFLGGAGVRAESELPTDAWTSNVVLSEENVK